MSKADLMFKEMVEDIINNGISNEGEFVRTKWEDGAPAYTIKKFGVINRYDLSKEFPIMTYRKTNWENALDEIFWIYQKQSNNIKDLNSKIWDLWADENGTIGKAYGWQLQSEKTNRVVKVDKKICSHHGELKNIKVRDLELPNKNCEDNMCGKIYNTKNYGDFIVLDVEKYKDNGKYNRKIVTIQFINTGNIKKIRKDLVRKNLLNDEYARTVYGVGYLGNSKDFRNLEFYNIYYSNWSAMLNRCYNIKCDKYSNYGGSGIFVDERWHNFENYIIDMERIPQYHLAKRDIKNYSVDKDYYSSNCYSKETCVWLERKENMIYKKTTKYFRLYKKEILQNKDNENIFISIKSAIDKYNLSKKSFTNAIYNKNEFYKDYKIEYIDLNYLNYSYRYELAKNQMDDVIYNLKYNKQNRRIMTNFWNFKDSPEKALQECAYSMTYNVVGNKLNAILNQRSSDVFVANNWNVVQYALLVHMLAKISNLEVGELVHVIADAHIYDKHIPIIKEMVKRETFEAPKLWINPDIKDFYDFKLSDFKLIGYNHNQQIKNIPIAV